MFQRLSKSAGSFTDTNRQQLKLKKKSENGIKNIFESHKHFVKIIYDVGGIEKILRKFNNIKKFNQDNVRAFLNFYREIRIKYGFSS